MKKILSICGCIGGAALFSMCSQPNTGSNATYTTDKDSTNILTTSGNRFISGVYPHLTTYAHARVNGIYGYGDECGIGAVIPWQGKLYMVNYAAHRPQGSEHKLYIVDENMNMTVYEGSVGGTPAARMIHAESGQLLIGHYLIDKSGNIRTIPIKEMPGRITAIARHLEDPENKVYYYDMEGMLYEANVNTLEVKKLFNNPLPGWHGKGGYTAQGKLVVTNNGEAWENPEEWKVPVDEQKGPDKFGVLAEYDGKNFKVVERKQFTDVTTRHGVNAVPNDNSPLWSIGWDKRSLRLKVMEDGKWYTYLLPKATYNNDPSHGWFTEWPRIREIAEGDMMMDMHGMFFSFPATFSKENTSGIRPISSHLRYIPDFCGWNGRIVLATDEVSIQGNILSGQPQSNLWFGSKEELSQWGPANGYGAIYLNDTVETNETSDPYLLAGFDRRIAHMINNSDTPIEFTIQTDEKGNGQWTDFDDIKLDGKEYRPLIFPADMKGEWMRIVTKGNGNISFILHYTTSSYNNGADFAGMFEGLAKIDEKDEILTGKLYSNRNNFNLSYMGYTVKNGEKEPAGDYEFQKFGFRFTDGITDTLAYRAMNTKVSFSKKMQFDAKEGNKELMKDLWSVDEASVILHTSKGNIRLPKGNAAFDNHRESRSVREVESERELANIHGTFYELPLIHVGREPLFEKMRPVASHNYYIDDYNTWNGLLVLSGIRKDAKTSNSVYINEERTAGVWFGSIDDLWKLGKPVGKGGPWKNTATKAGEMSDPYLMTGYDKKTLTLEADKDVKVTLWITVSQELKKPVKYNTFELKAGEKQVYEFPEGFSAHWAYLSADKDCTASAEFIYE